MIRRGLRTCEAAGHGIRRACGQAAATLLAVLLSLLIGGRSPAEERRLDREQAEAAAAQPLVLLGRQDTAERKQWQTRGHPRRQRVSSGTTARKPWETRGHPRKHAPTPRDGSANGPRAP
jgi:hypothetical protein